MEIKILKQIPANPNLKSWNNVGISMERINALEATYNGGKAFPLAVREFLFLCGKTNNLGFGTHDSIERLQELTREELADYNEEITRPFFAFDHVDNCSEFTFVFLDEDQEDPDVYLSSPYTMEDFGDPLVRRYKNYTFSSLVNDHIYRIKKGYSLD